MINNGKPYDKSTVAQIRKLSELVGRELPFSDSVKIWIFRVLIKVVHRFRKFDVRIANALSRLSEMQDKRDYLRVVTALARLVDANNSYTCGHSENVMRYSLRICQRLKLPSEEIDIIKTASQLHDIGKISINIAILKKAGPLTDDEWKMMKHHPVIGAEIIGQVGFLSDVVPIIRHHHERYEGGGYPDGNIKSSEIPLGSRIIAVADAFDAMTNERPYREALSKEAAISELERCSGSQFDQKIVKVFLGRK